MTMLTFTRGPFEPAHDASKRPHDAKRPLPTRLTDIKQFCICVVTVLLAMAAVAGVIALRIRPRAKS